MEIIIITSKRLFDGPERDIALEELWSPLYSSYAHKTFQILPYTLVPGTDILAPDCSNFLGRFSSLSVLPSDHNLLDNLVSSINSLGRAMVYIVDDNLAALSVGLRQRCANISLCLLQRTGNKTHNWRIFEDLFHHIEPWQETAPLTVMSNISSFVGGLSSAPEYPDSPKLKALKNDSIFHPLTHFFMARYFYWHSQGDSQFEALLSKADGTIIENNYTVECDRLTSSLTLLQMKISLPLTLYPEDVRVSLTVSGQDGEKVGTYDLLFENDYIKVNAEFLSLQLDCHQDIEAAWWTVDPSALEQTISSPYRHEKKYGYPIQIMKTHMKADEAIRVHPEHGQPLVFHDKKALFDGDKGDDIRSLRDKHKDETAWLIGNGPSVLGEDLDKLSNQLTFGFNRLYLAYDSMAFRPNYLLCADKQMIADFGSEIVSSAQATPFIASKARPDIDQPFFWLRQIECFPSVFSKDALHYVTSGGSTPYVAMQLAYYMGVRKFYFYGADFNFSFKQDGYSLDRDRSAHGDNNHFIKNYRSGKSWSPPELRNITSSFIAADIILRAEGGFVRNVTRGGNLDFFERDDFDAALQATGGRKQ